MNRLDYFMSKKDQNRFWWFQRNDYLPQIYANLSDDEFALLVEWFEETERLHMIGECNVPAMSAMLGFVEGNGIDAIVQCGHYAGYSSLLFGWALRRMGKKRGLFSIDINPDVTAFTQKWIEKAGLEEYVEVVVGDSADEAIAINLWNIFHSEPKMVFIDSSHQYAHTLRELNLWYEALFPGGLIFLHDVSEFAQGFDSTDEGGVKTALYEWGRQESFRSESMSFVGKIYQDGCGLGVIQK